jgi:hypothetical protein
MCQPRDGEQGIAAVIARSAKHDDRRAVNAAATRSQNLSASGSKSKSGALHERSFWEQTHGGGFGRPNLRDGVRRAHPAQPSATTIATATSPS